MKLLADRLIPLTRELYGQDFEISYYDYPEFKPDDLATADILLCRSNVMVNAEVLRESKIQIVATPSSGSDHFDKQYLAKVGIKTFHAPGCNAKSVADYVLACLALLRIEKVLNAKKLSVGIIGCGHVGSLVKSYCEMAGYSGLAYDPPRAEEEKDFQSANLEQIKACDIISLHTPLTQTGEHATYHLIDKAFIDSLRRNTILINTSRGAVVDTQAVLDSEITMIADVFENEPHIDNEFLNKLYLATPHIAGHAIQSKTRGSRMIHRQIMSYLQKRVLVDDEKLAHFTLPGVDWENTVLRNYNPRNDAFKFAEEFNSLRNNYQHRNELC